MECCWFSPVPLSLSNFDCATIILCPLLSPLTYSWFLLASRETREQGCLGPEASVVSQVSGYVCPHHSWCSTPLHHSACLR